MAAISYITSSEVTYSQHDTGYTLSKPAEVQDNDIILVSFCYWSLSTPMSITAPSGWELYQQHNVDISGDGTLYIHQVVYWKRASSEGSSWTWSWNPGHELGMDLTCLVYRGCARTGSPFDCSPTLSTTLGTSLTLSAITTATSYSWAVAMVHHNSSGNSSCASFDNERIDSGNDNACYDETRSTAGSTGSYVVTVPSSGALGILLALKQYIETVTRVVDPDMGTGYNYDSLADWESDLGDTTSGDLPAYGEIAVAKCRCTGGTADNGRCVIDGWTCDSTHYIKIWTDPSESYRHSGKWETGNKYRHVMTEDEAANIYITESYVQIIGLQLSTTTYTGRTYCRGIQWYEGTSGIASHNVIKAGASRDYSDGIRAGSGSIGPFYIYNNICYDFTATSSNGIYTENETNQEAYIYNNTIVNCTVGIGTGRYNQHDIKNNLVSGCTDAFSGSFRNSYNNATNNASLGTTYTAVTESNNHTSHTFTFVGAEDFHLQSTDTGARGLGVNLYNDANLAFQTDIDGDDRGGSGAVWDIGADEYIDSYQLPVNRQYIRGATATWYEVVDVYVLKDGVFVPDKIIKILDSGSWI